MRGGSAQAQLGPSCTGSNGLSPPNVRTACAFDSEYMPPTAMNFDEAFHNMVALTSTVALYRALVRRGLMTRDEAMQILLDEAVSQAIKAEQTQAPGVSRTTRTLIANAPKS